jgi:hypothetical protein
MEYDIKAQLQAVYGNNWNFFTLTGSTPGEVACAGYFVDNKWIWDYNYNNTGISFIIWQDSLPLSTY